MEHSELFKHLYGEHCDVAACEARVEKLKTIFLQEYTGDYRLFSSPGRVEICGNHTDHNHGKVLVGAITVDTLCFAGKADGKVTIKSEGYEPIEFNINALEFMESEAGTSQALAKGVLKAIKDKGFTIGGIYACTTSSVFKGAGVSSSASFEVLIAELMNYFYNEGKIDAVTRAVVAQYAENVYFKKPCGLLDQMGISLGGISYIDFGKENPQVKNVYMEFTDYEIFLINSGGDHTNLTYAYSELKEDMLCVASFFGERFLREVNEEDFYTAMPKLARTLSGRAILRAIHFFEENKRVDRAVNAVAQGDMDTFLKCVNESGKSSYELLQNTYVTGDQCQRVPLALALSDRYMTGGAKRVHGGGFAGTILAFVKKNDVAIYENEMNDVFGKENVFRIGIRSLGTCSIDYES